jgi:hypothetical protein
MRECRELWGHFAGCQRYPNRAQEVESIVQEAIGSAREQLERRDTDGRSTFISGVERLQRIVRAFCAKDILTGAKWRGTREYERAVAELSMALLILDTEPARRFLKSLDEDF